jgi:predicted NBD/HSP70 family sugar kinase
LENVPLQTILENEFKLPVLLENDVNLAVALDPEVIVLGGVYSAL